MSRRFTAVRAGLRSRHEPVEAPEVVLDGEHLDVAEAGLGGVGADRVAADHGAGRRGVLVQVPDRQAVQDAEAVVEALDLVARRGETLRHALVGDQDAAASARLSRALLSASTGWFMSCSASKIVTRS